MYRPDLNGSRLKNKATGQIYLMDCGKRRYIPNKQVYFKLFKDWDGSISDVDIDEIDEVDGIPETAILFKCNDSAKVFLLDGVAPHQKKRWIPSLEVFNRYYFNMRKVERFNEPLNEIDKKYPDGPDIAQPISLEHTFIRSHPQALPPTNELYIDRHFATTNPDGSKNHTIVGMHIILQKGNKNGLWETFHQDREKSRQNPSKSASIRSLNIYCDTLEVYGALSMPEANVTICARRLAWKTEDAAIYTSPLFWDILKASPGKNGADGRNAGNITLFIGKMETIKSDYQPARLHAEGGAGQDPGAGQDGVAGSSRDSWDGITFEISPGQPVHSSKLVYFNPRAVYVKYQWRWALSKVSDGVYGNDLFPTNGTNAKPPGKPGKGGNGGKLTTNLEAVKQIFWTTGGMPGTKERDYRGGAAGQPTSCAKYSLTLWQKEIGTHNAKYELSNIGSNQTIKGADALAPGENARGSEPVANILPVSNIWLQPLNLLKALEYIRDLYLAEDRKGALEYLSYYQEALLLPMPKEAGSWNEDSRAQWTAAQCEVATMLQRLHEHLDYFGNPAGYTPLFSLAGTYNLYKQETGRALKTLLLASWIKDKERDIKDAIKALDYTTIELNEDTAKAAKQVTDSEAKITDITKSIDALEKELNNMSNRLAILQNDLLTKAKSSLEQQAIIKSTIKMAAAICQVIPVGQPALGAIGSLSSVASNMIGGDQTAVPDTVSKIGDVIAKAREATKQANESVQAKKDMGDKSASNVVEARASAIAWSKIGDGLGPALAQVSEGLQALQVPQSEVEAELQRLESQSQEWNELVKDIRDLNERKATLASDLADAFQSLGDGYTRASSNAAAVFSMQQERANAQGRLNPMAIGFVEQMGQRSRLTLLRYLYFMVKAYETTVFKPIDISWKLDAVTEKITELMKPVGGFDINSLSSLSDVLGPLYEANLDSVRNQLIGDFPLTELTLPLSIGLSDDDLKILNNSEQVVIDPISYGLILPDYELIRLSKVALKTIEFDPNGPKLDDKHSVIVSLQPAHRGIIRKSEALYSIYSDLSLEWAWTCKASKDQSTVEISSSEMSDAAKDMQNLILGDGAENIRQKVSIPPAWSDLTIIVDIFPADLPKSRWPIIARLDFEFQCNLSRADDRLRVLNVQSLGSAAGAVIQCSPDLANRSNGFSPFIRIFEKGANVSLSAPSNAGGSNFKAWDLTGEQIERKDVKQAKVDIKLDDHVLAKCYWE